MRKRFYTYLFLCLSASLMAQSIPNCVIGAPSQPIYHHGHVSQTGVARTDQYVPLSFHIIGDDNGQHRTSYQNIFAAVCITNQQFAGTGLQFYVKNIDQPLNGNLLQTETVSYVNTLLLNADSSAVDVFIAETSFGGNYGYNSFTYFLQDISVIDADVLDGDHYSLAHQMGHIFGLIHPFDAWVEYGSSQIEGYYDLTGQLPAIDTLPNGLPVELANGDNCETAGDGICDTPPDYYFGAYVQGCPQELVILDPLGDTIPWMPGNIMGSILDCPLSTYYFSTGQAEAMRNSYMSPEKDYLRILPQPQIVSTAATNLLTPTDEQTMNGQDVYFSWMPVEGVSNYLIEISRISTFSFLEAEILVTGNELTLPCSYFPPDRTYNWRVRPLGVGAICTPPFSETFRFRTSPCALATSEIASIADWQIVTNPQAKSLPVSLQITANDQLSLAIHITNLAGQLIHIESRNISIGNHFVPLTEMPLPSGVYVVSLVNGSNTSSKRLVVY